jgi:hypothetical protein
VTAVTPISRPATTEVKSAVPSWIKRSGTSKDLLETPTPRGEDVETKRSRYLRLFDVIDINGDGDVSVAELISSFRFAFRANFIGAFAVFADGNYDVQEACIVYRHVGRFRCAVEAVFRDGYRWVRRA